MGTNYYLHQKERCECCGRDFAPLHIGKSSGGWCFALHVIPEENINTLDDWRALWSKPGAFILDEYGNRITDSEMLDIIMDRRWHGQFPVRSKIDFSHCVGHGPGTWDYIIGDFS